MSKPTVEIKKTRHTRSKYFLAKFSDGIKGHFEEMDDGTFRRVPSIGKNSSLVEQKFFTDINEMLDRIYEKETEANEWAKNNVIFL